MVSEGESLSGPGSLSRATTAWGRSSAVAQVSDLGGAGLRLFVLILMRLTVSCGPTEIGGPAPFDHSHSSPSGITTRSSSSGVWMGGAK